MSRLSQDESSEIDALLDGLFTERSELSTSRSVDDEEVPVRKEYPHDNALATKLSALGTAVDLAYADYVIQQQSFGFAASPEEIVNESNPMEIWRTQPDESTNDQQDHNSEQDLPSELEFLYEDDESRVVQFDVGGRIFRCKASVINKYPGARLHDIITSGSDRFFESDTFFIDRSARNFEVVLDFYRTGKVYIPPGISRGALEQDARYFGIFDKMFCSESTVSTQEPAQSDEATQKDFRFARRERHCLVPNALPLVYRIRRHEQLVVASVKGYGKLMARVCDPTGMQFVHVDQAVLYDSKTQFFLDGARAHLPVNTLLPGDFVYTLWVEQHPAGYHDAALDIEVQLLSSFSEQDLIPGAAVLQPLQSERSTRSIPATSETARTNPPLSPVLFLPPFMQTVFQSDADEDNLLTLLSTATRGRMKGTMDGTNKNIGTSAATPKPKINFVARAAAAPRVATRSPIRTNQAMDIPTSPIRRTGAAIAATRGVNETKPDGKVTVYRPDKLSFAKDF